MPMESLPKTKYITFISHANYHLYDTNEFMLETDILLNDYSNASTDFSLLNRPQVFYMPDYDEYVFRQGFIEDYKSILPGYEIKSYNDLKNTIIDCINDPQAYLKKYENKKNKLLEHYYDIDNTNSCEKFCKFIDYKMK